MYPNNKHRGYSNAWAVGCEALEDVLAAIPMHLPVSVEISRHLKSLYLFRQSAITDMGTETTAVLPHTVTHYLCENCWDYVDPNG